MDVCEMCCSRKGTWHVVDDNAEAVLCRSCVAQLRAECTVEKIK